MIGPLLVPAGRPDAVNVPVESVEVDILEAQFLTLFSR